MKILLLGKDGQVGWQLQAALAPLGELIACGRSGCDLSDPDRLRQVLRAVSPDVIVNAAAYTAVDKAETERELNWRVNAEAPAVLATEACRQGALLVHYSTDYVFEGSKDAPYTEDDAPAPLNEYGRSKLAGEEAIRAAGGRSLVFRTSWVFGDPGRNFVRSILRLAGERESLAVVDDQIGSPTPAALIATVTGLVLAAHRYGQPEKSAQNSLYHLAAAHPVSWCEFARTIVRHAGALPGAALRLTPSAITAIPGADYPSPACRPANSRLDCTRLQRDFGLVMPDWEPYLARLLARRFQGG